MKQSYRTCIMLVSTVLLQLSTLQAQSSDPLLFPVNNFTLDTKTVMTSEGKKKVTFKSYMHIPYVSAPVDLDYQSLNVSVPVKIEESEIDATQAPVLLVIGVGGYMSSRNRGVSPGRERNSAGELSSIPDLALAAGYVVVSPGCRGRDNQAEDGTYYGKAPAAIVDLKAAVRYIRYNDELMPGNAEKIVSTGCSAGGALSALLGVSGNSNLFDGYLEEIGAAPVNDHIYASACFSPITDLDHADMAYEWMFGSIPARSGLVDQDLSNQLKEAYAKYQASLNLHGKNGFGTLTADNYGNYLLKYYLIPSANSFILEMSDKDRKAYLAENSWIKWSGNGVSFEFDAYVQHGGRMKGLPAFDDFNRQQPEPILFGTRTTNSRHFTNFSLRQSSSDPDAEIEDDLKTVVNMMNAMYFIETGESDCAGYWWIRNGTRDNHTSQTVAVNLAASLEIREKHVNTWLFWDGGHCANDDPEGLISWIGEVTGSL